MFLNRNNPEWVANREATRYEMIQNRENSGSGGKRGHVEKEIIIKKYNVPVGRDNFYRSTGNKEDEQSLIPGMSKGQYSFEDEGASGGLEGLTSAKKDQE